MRVRNGDSVVLDRAIDNDLELEPFRLLYLQQHLVILEIEFVLLQTIHVLVEVALHGVFDLGPLSRVDYVHIKTRRRDNLVKSEDLAVPVVV